MDTDRPGRRPVLAQRSTDRFGFTPELADAVDRKTVRELLAKAPLVLADLPNKGAGWHVHPALFARAGATPAAHAELAAQGGMVVELAQLVRDLMAFA